MKLFGPVLYYDLIRGARRRQQVILRCLYALVLMYLLFALYFMRLADQGRELNARQMADFNAKFFGIFMLIQMVTVFLLTPVYAAGAIGAEKERGTLIPVLTTDLRNHEIVLSLLVSRLATLALVLLTGLPILTLLEFVGGIDPNALLAGFAITGLTLLSVGSLGVLQSVLAQKSRTAIIRTYLWTGIYLAVSGLSQLLLTPGLDLATFPSTDDWKSPVTLEDVVTWSNVGNIASITDHVYWELRKGTALDTMLPALSRGYAWFHGTVAAICIIWAILRMRALTLAHASDSTGNKAGRHAEPPARWLLARPLLGRWPMLWKEVAIETSMRRRWLSRLGMGILVAITFLPPLHLMFWYGSMLTPTGCLRESASSINSWIRVAGGIIGCLMLVQVMVRAAGSVSGERVRQTLDGLLTTPFEAKAIVRAKWLGSIFAPRLPWLLLALIWSLGWMTGALAPLAILCYVMVWLSMAMFLAALGLYFSAWSPTTQRATLWTLASTMAILGATFFLAYDTFYDTGTVGGVAFVPMLALGFVAYYDGDFPGASAPPSQAQSVETIILYIGLGTVLWTFLAGLFWYMSCQRFLLVVGRGKRDKARPDAKGAPPGWAPRLIEAPLLMPSFDGVAANGPASESSRRFFGRPREGILALLHLALWQRWLKKLPGALLVILPIGLLYVMYGVLVVSGERRLARAIAEADRLDPGWRLADLEARRPVLADDQNSALQAAKAAAVGQRKEWPFEDFDKANKPEAPPNELFTDQQSHFLRQGMTIIAADLPEARKLADMPNGNYPLIIKSDYISTTLDHVERIRQVASRLGYDVFQRAEEGDLDGALVSCQAILNCGRSIDAEPMLISQLMRMAIRSKSVRKLERTLAQGEPSDTPLRTMQRLLEMDAEDPLLLIGVRGERAGMDQMMQVMQNGQSPLSRLIMDKMMQFTRNGLSPSSRLILFSGRPSGGIVPNQETLERVFSGSLTSQRAALLRYHNQLVEVAKLPAHQQGPGFAALVKALLDQPLLVRAFVSASYTVSQIHNRTQAEIRCAAVAMAAERYRRQHHAWPAKLKDMVPEFIKQVPLDPIDGLPLRYGRKPDGVVIYSVGFGGIDNGGDLRPARNGDIANVGIQLWDVVHRRQVPLNPAMGPPAP